MSGRVLINLPIENDEVPGLREYVGLARRDGYFSVIGHTGTISFVNTYESIWERNLTDGRT